MQLASGAFILGGVIVVETVSQSKQHRLWSRQTDSNRRPADYKSAALPAELCRHFKASRILHGKSPCRKPKLSLEFAVRRSPFTVRRFIGPTRRYAHTPLRPYADTALGARLAFARQLAIVAEMGKSCPIAGREVTLKTSATKRIKM